MVVGAAGPTVREGRQDAPARRAAVGQLAQPAGPSASYEASAGRWRGMRGLPGQQAQQGALPRPVGA